MNWWSELLEKSAYFMPHGHCYLWLPGLLWLHVVSDALIGAAYVGIALILWLLVRRIRLPFSPVFIAFGLFIALCGGTHFMEIWTVWTPDYVSAGLVKAATALASVATAIGLFHVRPQVEALVHAARLSEERRIRLESTHAELAALLRKVTELDQQKTRFFANVSHELRTPLALIIGPTEQLLSDGGLTDRQSRALHVVAGNARSLLRQVNDLLDVARFEAGPVELRYSAADASAWLGRVASQFQPVAEQHGIDYAIELPEPLLVEADFDRLERVVLNLLANAFKFTPAGGRVRVALGRVDPEQWQFSVNDSGVGVPAELREQVFERFRQGDAGDGRHYGGTGLGLAIARDFVQMHRGSIRIEDSREGGACVVARLPICAPAGANVDAAAPSAPCRGTQAALGGILHSLVVESTPAVTAVDLPGRARVLVVEDNAEMRDFIVSTLAVSHNVAAAAEGAEALRMADVQLPDLIVSDLMMPGMSGEQLLATLRQRSQFDAVPVLMLTAKADDALRVRLLQNGAQDFLLKPFLPQELSARAGNLLVAKRAGDTLREGLSSLSTDLDRLADEITRKNRQLRTALDSTEVAREQAERASRTKSYFLGLISHELRTPLSTILLNLQLAARATTTDDQPRAQRTPIERMAAAAQQMTTLVEGLLQYTRVESGRIASKPEPIDAHALAQEIVQQHRDAVPAAVRLDVVAPSEPLPTLVSDPSLLRVVLSNLLSNALKFTHAGEVSVHVSAADGCCRFEVRDTGIGIPPEDLTRIFQPFEQLEPLQRKSIPGVGLGLALVKQIVEALDGRIEVDSRPGVGSVFAAVLPVQLGDRQGRGA